MAKPNYGYEKRQRELEKKKKKAEKALKKSAGPDTGDAADAGVELDSACDAPDGAAALADDDAPGDAPAEGAGSAG